MLLICTVFLFLNFASAQYLHDPFLEILPPTTQNLVAIPGPAFVDASSLKSALLSAYPVQGQLSSSPVQIVVEEKLYNPSPYAPYVPPPQIETYADYVPSNPAYNSYGPNAVQYVFDSQKDDAAKRAFSQYEARAYQESHRQLNDQPKLRYFAQDPRKIQNDQVQAYGRGQLQNAQHQHFGLGQHQNGQIQRGRLRRQFLGALGLDFDGLLDETAQNDEPQLNDEQADEPQLNDELGTASAKRTELNDQPVQNDEVPTRRSNLASLQNQMRSQKGYETD